MIYQTPPFGERGRITHSGDTVQCHVCGNFFAGLATHIRTHGITAREYRREFGLHRTLGLVSDRLHLTLSAVRGAGLKNHRRLAAVACYELACVVCGAPIVVRLPKSAVKPTLCSARSCQAVYTQWIHAGHKETAQARQSAKLAARKRNNEHLRSPSVRAKAAATMRGRVLPEHVREKLRGCRTPLLTLSCAVCGQSFTRTGRQGKRACCSAACLNVRRQQIGGAFLNQPHLQSSDPTLNTEA